MHLLKSYAWLLGDLALVAFAVFELVSLRSSGTTKPPKDETRPGPPS